MGRLTTHVLDTANGRPAAGGSRPGLRGRRHRRGRAAPVARRRSPMPTAAATRRCWKGEAFKAGRYEIVFGAGAYFAAVGAARSGFPFVEDVVLRFGIDDAAQHYHVPLLVSPWSYSTYRGS